MVIVLVHKIEAHSHTMAEYKGGWGIGNMDKNQIID